MIRAAAVIAAVLLATQQVQAQDKSPAPDFVVKSQFEELMARNFAKTCAGLAFDPAGFDRHMRALLGEYSNRGIDAREAVKTYAPIDETSYSGNFAAFMQKHDLSGDEGADVFCAVGRVEAEERTPLGQLLRIVE